MEIMLRYPSLKIFKNGLHHATLILTCLNPAELNIKDILEHIDIFDHRMS